MPQTNGVLAQLRRVWGYSSLDLVQGFFQVLLAPRICQKLPFCATKDRFNLSTCHLGTWWSSNTPSINGVFDKAEPKYATAFSDGILVYSESFEEHLQHSTEFLGRIQEPGLLVNLAKASLSHQSLRFLGHIIVPEECVLLAVTMRTA